MSDRVAVFNDGRIQQLAPPDELYERPVNSFVAQFIGENNKPGTIETELGGDLLVRLDTAGDRRPGERHRPGERTLVSIRPERVELKPARLPPAPIWSRPRCWSSSTWATSVPHPAECGRQRDFVMKTRNAPEASAATPASIRIGWRPEDCRALALDPAEAGARD
jgi:putative spermidine/putrescine transport system ATP-binding protein